MPLDEEIASPRSAADEGEAQEGESLRLPEASPPAVLRRISTELDQSGLLQVETQRKLLKSRTHRVEEPTGVGLSLKADDDVIRKTEDDYIAGRLALSPTLRPEIKDIVQVDVGEQRRCHRSLPCSHLTRRDDSVFENARLEPFSDQADDARIADPMLQETDKPFLANRVEKRSDVAIKNVVHPHAADSDNESIQRIVLAAPWSE